MKTEDKKLRSGFTTGTASAAAVKGGLILLIKKKFPDKVTIRFLSEGSVEIPLKVCKMADATTAICSVIKDAGDDPDVTHKAEIGAFVKLVSKSSKKNEEIIIKGGEGVGTVTKPGLGIQPGEPAINPGPRKMIKNAVFEVLKKEKMDVGVEAEIFVKGGDKIAEKTLNLKLGIVGGISILGTTGIVKPMSHEAYIASINSALSVANATGVKKIVLTSGRRSERYSQRLFSDFAEEAFVQIGDFFKRSIENTSIMNFDEIIIAVFFGKALKMSQKIPHTHAAKSELTLNRLAEWAFEFTNDYDLKEKILEANTARHAFDFLKDDHLEIISHVGKQVITSAHFFSKGSVSINCIIFDFDGNIIFNSMGARGEGI